MFNITQQKGFHMTFANGNTVSVQWGRGNYCDNYSKGTFDGPTDPSKDAEMMVWDKDGNTLAIPNEDGSDPGYVDVRGHMSPEHVAAVIARYSK